MGTKLQSVAHIHTEKNPATAFCLGGTLTPVTASKVRPRHFGRTQHGTRVGWCRAENGGRNEKWSRFRADCKMPLTTTFTWYTHELVPRTDGGADYAESVSVPLRSSRHADAGYTTQQRSWRSRLVSCPDLVSLYNQMKNQARVKSVHIVPAGRSAGAFREMKCIGTGAFGEPATSQRRCSSWVARSSSGRSRIGSPRQTITDRTRRGELGEMRGVAARHSSSQLGDDVVECDSYDG